MQVTEDLWFVLYLCKVKARQNLNHGVFINIYAYNTVKKCLTKY